MTTRAGTPGRLGPGVPLVLIAAAVLAAGCTHGGSANETGPPPIAWDSTVPIPMRTPTGAAAPPCQASALQVEGGGFEFSAEIAGGTGTVVLRNAGATACRLAGRPGVQVVGAVPAPQQHTAPLPAEPPAFPAAVPPDAVLLAVPPGGAVSLGVDWRNWCIPPSAAVPVPPRAIRLTLPDNGGAVDVGYNAVPPCDDPTAASTIGVRPVQPAPLPATAAWTSTPLQASIRPVSGKRGQTARFVVELRNATAAPVPFDRCPLFVELLAPAGRPEVHQLNCQAAGELPAGGSLRFEMHIQVPTDAPSGDNGLFWELDPTGAAGPEAVSRVEV